MAAVMIDIPGIGQVEAKNAASEETLKQLLAVMSSAGSRKPPPPSPVANTGKLKSAPRDLRRNWWQSFNGWW